MSFQTADGIRVFRRADWGAKPPKGAYSRQPYKRSLVYHHGGDEGKPRPTFDAMAKTLRSWQAFHQGPQRGWLDIGYHFLMDGLGRIYVGRPSTAIGAHVLEENTGRLGLCFVQDGRRYGLTDDQEETVRKLFKGPHRLLGLPALKDLARHSGDDWGVFGHREVPRQATECPGDKIAADMHRIIRSFT